MKMIIDVLVVSLAVMLIAVMFIFGTQRRLTALENEIRRIRRNLWEPPK